MYSVLLSSYLYDVYPRKYRARVLELVDFHTVDPMEAQRQDAGAPLRQKFPKLLSRAGQSRHSDRDVPAKGHG